MNDMLKVSCVKGFKYFVMHIRSREEMICSIINEPSVPILLSASNSPSNSFSAQEKRSPLIMSQKQQKRLSGYGFINVGLPPASPSGSEGDENDDYTMFLLAAYSRYNSPYVWIRTNHSHLVKLATPDSPEKDYPLLLKTTSQWAEKDVKVWHVLAELVHICCTPSPPNPFAVDFDYFDSLHLSERALASGAMVRFLQQVLANGPHSYDRKVHSDLLKIAQRHFLAMMHLVEEEVKVPELLSLDKGHSQSQGQQQSVQRVVEQSQVQAQGSQTTWAQPSQFHVPSTQQSAPSWPMAQQSWQ
eukprot:Em0192g7a